MVAVVLMSRRKLWPFLIFGYILALAEGTTLAGTVRHPGILEILGNVFEIALAALTLPPYRNLKQWLQEPRLLPAFTGYALILGPAVMSLTIALKTARTTGAVADLHAGFWQRARIIGVSESLGIALGLSLVLVLANRQTWRLFRWNSLPTTVGLLSALGLSTWFALNHAASSAVLVPYAILIAIAFFLGLRGAVLGLGVACAIVSAFSAHSPLLTSQTAFSQNSLALAIITILPLSVALFNRSVLEQRLKDHEAELDKLKSLDRLTGVANRKRFDLVLAREWQRATRDPKPIALLMIDIDYFDLYNQHYGRHSGDECLRFIASKLTDQPHRHYDLVSRFDGGRFSVLLPGAPGDAIERMGEDLRAEVAALELPHERSQFERITVSIGWASMVPEVDIEPSLLIGAAEAALASAKRKGKNRVEGFTSPAVEMAAVGR